VAAVVRRGGRLVGPRLRRGRADASILDGRPPRRRPRAAGPLPGEKAPSRDLRPAPAEA